MIDYDHVKVAKTRIPRSEQTFSNEDQMLILNVARRLGLEPNASLVQALLRRFPKPEVASYVLQYFFQTTAAEDDGDIQERILRDVSKQSQKPLPIFLSLKF